MYLEKLEIQGFKSFAKKTVLKFPGILKKDQRGLTAIVGPNGSGKSNIADAARWALGEQSAKTLRGRKREDVIFAGAEKKGRLSVAEVSLHLNNEEKKGVDYSQIVLTRRVFRDGASEYLINGAKARLLDIELLLARANFGQRTYSVIGQGMVEGFLNTSPAERKNFFDEATGVKKFQIKRDDALAKMRASYDNLTQADLITAEIEPRLKHLSKQAEKMRERAELEKALIKLQIAYYGRLWHEMDAKFNQSSAQFLELEKTKIAQAQKLETINEDLLEMEKTQDSEKFKKLQAEQSALQNQKNAISGQVARLSARLEAELERAGQFDAAWLHRKKEELEEELAKSNQEADQLKINLKEKEAELEPIKTELQAVLEKIKQANLKIAQINTGLKQDKGQSLNEKLASLLGQIKIEETEIDLAKLKNLLTLVKKNIQKILKSLNNEEEKEQAQAAKKELEELGRSQARIIQKKNEINLSLIQKKERLRLLLAQIENKKQEIQSIEAKIAQSQAAPETAQKDINAKQAALKAELAKLETQIKQNKAKSDELNQANQAKQALLFQKQKQARAIQTELNQVQNKLNEIKINQARQETRLEDLEAEIRSQAQDSFDFENEKSQNQEKEQQKEKLSLKQIKRTLPEGYIDLEESKAKIQKIKRQLEFIGNIDPRVENELDEIKSRYDFLSGQTQDLKKTIESLRKIIKDLDKNIKEKFDSRFQAISQKFRDYFKILFNGGEAKIVKILAEDEEQAEGLEENKKAKDPIQDFFKEHNATGLAGIDIKATPPGKKIQTINMLSGGERALSAIALICACLATNPSPFVILDEVDAALDEANSERLAKILDDLSRKTQFITITHNRSIMRQANILYGVTMEDSGVSKLLSVNLEEAVRS